MKTKTQNQITTALLLLLACVLMSGCSSVRDQVPATQINGSINGKPFTFIGPKNVNITNFDIAVNTNGNLHVHVGSITAAMDPGVIQMTTQGYAAMRNADSQMLNSAITTVAGAVGQVGGTAAKTAVVP